MFTAAASSRPANGISSRDVLSLLDGVLRAARPRDDRISSDEAVAGRLAEVCGGLPDKQGVQYRAYPRRGKGAEASSCEELPVNGDQLRQTWFWPPRLEQHGYRAWDVDDLVSRVAAELDAGRPAGPLIGTTELGKRRWGRRYDIDAVDWLLGQFLVRPGQFGPAGMGDDPWCGVPVAQLAADGVSGQASRYSWVTSSRRRSRANFARQCDRTWLDFDQLPGPRLWHGFLGKLEVLCTEDRQLVASVRKGVVSAGGRNFTCTFLAKHKATPRKTWSSPLNSKWQTVMDEAKIPILYVGLRENYNWRALSSILFPDQRWLRFLVRGTREPNAVMTAVDQAGDTVARYRLNYNDLRVGHEKLRGYPKLVQIAVHPDRQLTDELALVLMMSARRWLEGYFERPSGGS